MGVKSTRDLTRKEAEELFARLLAENPVEGMSDENLTWLLTDLTDIAAGGEGFTNYRIVEPDLIANVRLYAGGRKHPIYDGWGCPCMVSQTHPQNGWDARLILSEPLMMPGTEQRAGFVFLTTEGADAIRQAGTFFLWEGGIIGEATVV